MISIIFIVGLIVLAAVLTIGTYNDLISFRNRFKNAFSQIDVQMKRRYDLIPNLVETSKAYMQHERETLEAVIQSRNRAFQAAEKAGSNPADSSAIKNLSNEEALLGQSLGRLMALVESYPDLKANQTMTQLMEELTSTENKISFSRQAFNDSVMAYNIAREKFPNSVIAGFFNFKEASPYEIENPEERNAPKVAFH